MYYDKIRHRNNQVLAATGLTTVEFDALLISLRWPSPRPIDGFTFFLIFSGVHWKRLVNYRTVIPNVWYTFFKDAKKYCWTEQSDLFNVLWMKTGSQHAIVVKKTHSIKNNLLCTNQLRIVWLSSTYEGHVHDKKICDEEPLLLPKGIRLWQDTGFIGHRPDGVEICMPKKKPEGKELTAVEKQENKRISGISKIWWFLLLVDYTTSESVTKWVI